MTKTWIEPIFDRTYADVQSVQYDPDQTNPKGCWNAVDLNRIEHNTAYCAEWLLEKKIVHTAPEITVREDGYWTGDMIPTKSETDRIINNVKLLIQLSSNNPAIADQLPTIYAATQVNYVLANQIEFALDLMHDQPKLPLEYWQVTIVNGVVDSVIRDDGTIERINSSTALVAEDEIVTIRGVEYGEYARYQTFSYWSAPAADLGLLDDSESQTAIFTMPYRDISFTANFETHIPRTLTLTNGYISPNKDPRAESGPRTGTFYAGDEIMIIADIAATGKAFYEWLGTQEGLDNIVGVTYAEDPSTAILTMPDCDVSLNPHYINAGQHSVTVNSGTGGGWYDYNDYVSISATVPSHYRFSHWSGATSYLEDIYSSYQSFRMGDVNISFTANFTYVYSYNNVQVIDGYISVNGQSVSRAENLRQSTSYTLIPTPPNGQGLDYWSIEGQGSVNRDSLGNYGNTFTVGDGNAIITGHYAPLRTLTIVNQNNNGGTSSSQLVQTHKTTISTNSSTNDSIFLNWTNNGTVVSSSSSYTVTMPSSDLTLTANYRAKNTVSVTINYGSHSETVSMLERSSKSITADAAPSGKHFSRWEYSGLYSISSSTSSSTTIYAGSGNGTITAIYADDTPPATYHNLTVNYGSGSGSVREGGSTTIRGNQAPSTYEFDYWSNDSGNGSIANVYNSQTTYYMGNTDGEVTAHYKPIPYFTVTVQNGYVYDGSGWVTEATLLRNSTNQIKMKPAPTGYQFLQWEVYVNGVLQTDANDVLQPLAETTTLRNLLRNITLKATYYVPDPTVMYTLTVHRKDGSTDQYTEPVGTNITVYASSPDTGKEFYKWTGDTAYVAGGIYNETTYVHMPSQNIEITENYVNEGYIPQYDLEMKTIYALCCYETSYTDPETGETTVTENWVTRHSYPEGSIVKVKCVGYDAEYFFSEWNAYNHDTLDSATSVFTNNRLEETTLIMPDYDIDAEPTIALKTTYELSLVDGYTAGGRTSAYYYTGARADVYFAKTNTADIHYQFTRWTGPTVSQIELYSGGMFDVTNPGTSLEPQYIKMPGQNTAITATYKTLYRLTLVNGTIDSTSTSEEFYENGTVVNITADTRNGMTFQYWSGDTTGVANIYDPTTTVTITNSKVDLTAVYSTDTDRNGIGYVTTSLKSVNTIDNNDITIVSGEIEVGFIITDSDGHIYIITSVDTTNDTSTIYRMTKIVQGGNIYG